MDNIDYQSEGEECAFTDIDSVSSGTRIDQRINTMTHTTGKQTLLPVTQAGLEGLDQLTRWVLKNDQPLFVVDDKYGYSRLKATSKEAEGYFNSLRSILGCYSRTLTFPPHITLLFELYRKHPIHDCLCRNYLNRPDGVVPEGEIANDFVGKYREAAERDGVRKKLDDWDRRAETNFDRLEKYLDALFDAYARIVTVRVDFYYHAALVEPEKADEMIAKVEQAHTNETLDFLTGVEEEPAVDGLARVGIEEVMRDRDRLFENTRSKPSLFKNRIGHVWRIEYSRVGGYHLHCAFFFDGSKVQQHEWLAQQICDYWRDSITNGRGYAYNCNRNRYPDYVLGATDYYDRDKRDRLLMRMSYLAKDDQLVYAKPSAKCKLFGTGRMRHAKNTGRPRKK